MAITINGTTGIAGVDGSAATPAVQGADTNTGVFYPAADTVGVSTGGTERMRIDSSGNVGIGTASPSYPLDIRTTSGGGFGVSLSGGTTITTAQGTTTNVDMNFVTKGAGIYTFTQGSTERMRIDSSGNLLVAQSATSQTTIGASMQSTGQVYSCLAASTNAATSYLIYSTGAGAYRFYVQMDGKINATSTTIAAISDIRLKENVRDLDFGLSEIMSLKPRRFDWKENKGMNIKDAVGFIAQEFETVFPASVSTSLAGEDGIEYKNICHEELIPTFVKAIQEQQALITQLQADVAALKGTP